MVCVSTPPAASSGYRHAAVFYAGMDGFLEQTLPFIRAGVAAHEPTLVVVAAAKVDELRGALGRDDYGVEFADMADVGANPARIIPAWQEFVGRHGGRRVRGIGEPISPERRPAELVECQHHERLLNPALADSNLHLICPYDTDALAPEVIDEARHSHPLVGDAAAPEASVSYEHEAAARGLFVESLPEPPSEARVFEFSRTTLPELRALVRAFADTAELPETRRDDLVLATGELATNSVRHAGGVGALRLWRDDTTLICEIADSGQIDDPLLDRRRPEQGQLGGWGLWIANQACDLVQLRSLPTGTVARMHMRLR